MAILVTGATGLVGRLLVDELLDRGAPVLAATRTPSSTGEVPPDHLDGVDTVFLHPRAVRDPFAFVRRARLVGVRKVVAMAAANVDDPLDEQPSRVVGDRNKEAEEAAAGSGLTWVSLRPSTFAANTARSFGPQLRAGDVVRYVHPSFQESVLDEGDLAAVAAHALLTGDLDGERVLLTGPQDLSHAEMVAVLGQVLGRSLRFEEIPEPAAVPGLPGDFAAALMARYARHRDKPQHPATGAVAAILGRPARTYAQWVAAHAGLFERR